MDMNLEMQSFAARLQSFQEPYQLSKRRASSQTKQKKGAGNTIEWPHELPTADDLARAGFYYSPAQESADNVQCFFCKVKLDGWEPEDSPIKEHLAHAPTCQWARALEAGKSAQHRHENLEEADPRADRDPMCEELVAARKATFSIGNGWPHEGKRGWKCKVSKLVEAGWCFDPNPAEADVAGDEEVDSVTCFYCSLSLDGWEPKDDPWEEHRRRSTDCAFFALVEQFGSGKDDKKAKTKGEGGQAGRASMASKTSRMSTQSALSEVSERRSLADVDRAAEEIGAEVEDSMLSTASQATAIGTTKGKKRGPKAKAAPKGAKGRKRASTVDSKAAPEPLYPDLSSHETSHRSQPEDEIAVASQPIQDEETAMLPAKKIRKGTRQSKQPQPDSSVVEISSLDVAAPKKNTRGRKPKAKPQPQSNQAYDAEDDLDNSEVSAQLQEELEKSIGSNFELDDATPQPQSQPVRPKRGVKRTSTGVEKQREIEDVSAVLDGFPPPPPPVAAPVKAKRGRKPSKVVNEDKAPMSESEAEPAKSAKAKKGVAKKGGRGRKPSSTRSSKATITAESPMAKDNEPEDLERDEREIDAELQRIANEQQVLQVQAEQEKIIEFEPSPHMLKHVNQIAHLEQELRAEVEELQTAEGENMANYVASVAVASPPGPPVPSKERNPSPGLKRKLQASSTTHHAARQVDLTSIPGGWPLLPVTTQDNATPSPSGSDKENQPSAKPHLSAKKSAPIPILSPTKTTRVPLAPGTPNRPSPSKREMLLLSPSKQLSQITTTQPWVPVDLDSILLPLNNPSPGTLAEGLAGAAGGVLPTSEKQLTVEDWVKYRAKKGEEELRRGCEEMVAIFEREGLRALESLNGIIVGGS